MAKITNIAETKGYWTLRGKIWGLNNKKIYENEYTKDLSLGIQLSKNNSNFIGINTFKNITNVYVSQGKGKTRSIPYSERNNLNEGENLIGVSIKYGGMEKSKTVVELDAIQEIKDKFKDGDSIFVKCNTKLDTYHNKLGFQIQQMYISKDEVDITAEDFNERNEFVQDIIFMGIDDDKKGLKILGKVADYRGILMDVEFITNNEEIMPFINSCKVGDLVKLGGKVMRTPIFEEVEDLSKPSNNEFTPIGKVPSGYGEKKNNKFKKITGYEEYIEIESVLDCEKSKYSREDIRTAIEQIQAYNDKNVVPKESIEDEDLPF